MSWSTPAGRTGSLGWRVSGKRPRPNILKAIDFRKTTQASRLLSEALRIGEELVRRAEQTRLFARVDIAGSLRRGKSTFKDIDILLVPKKGKSIESIREKLISFADTDADGPAVIGAGDTKVSLARQGLQVDFRIVPEASYPSALQHFTGSKEHNTLLRSRAKTMGLKMSEWGVFDAKATALPLKDEAAVYASVGLAFIAPELREADGEIEAAETGTLPKLVSAQDFRGMIHVHSSASDGTRTVEEMARECIRRGYSWLCLSDHSRSAGVRGRAVGGGSSCPGKGNQSAEHNACALSNLRGGRIRYPWRRRPRLSRIGARHAGLRDRVGAFPAHDGPGNGHGAASRGGLQPAADNPGTSKRQAPALPRRLSVGRNSCAQRACRARRSARAQLQPPTSGSPNGASSSAPRARASW